MIINTKRSRFLTWMFAAPAILACVLWPVHAYVQTPLAFSSDTNSDLHWALETAPVLAPMVKRQGQSGLESLGLPQIQVSILEIEEREESISNDSPGTLRLNSFLASAERAPPNLPVSF